MIDNVRPDPFLIADNAALDFMNSECFFGDGMIEWIGNGADLLSWMVKSDLITEDIRVASERQFSQKSLDDVAIKARSLRDWLRAFTAGSEKSDLKILTDILAKDNLYWTVTQGDDDHALVWRQERTYKKASDLLLPIAEVIGDFICNVDHTHTRNCEGPQCTLWFNDVTKNRKRRWCSMSVCGNRAKVAAHRERKRKLG
ncbi:hypothetical protein F9L33_08810 [Amylibacter sp. SFDW26]|uniref:CGNR zinc finger domain-containing protein n=1 Tax=Amylibacter sp. SFDW26 TaxID=2652722 RepID=UPI001262502E|nr:CGNR zinc finger domain-containing protein [Amylibacter sp. SFDW26]KAB7614717.1 hypothetical protein F9L33_08810 [Amylibacter sp. SFDW26]